MCLLHGISYISHHQPNDLGWLIELIQYFFRLYFFTFNLFNMKCSKIAFNITLLLFFFISLHAFSQNFSGNTLKNGAQPAVKKNAIYVKLTTAPTNARGRSFNISTLDKLNIASRTQSVRRVFPDAGKYEKAHRAYGLHLWYEIEFSEAQPNERIDSLCRVYQRDSNVLIAEPVYLREHGLDTPREPERSNGLFSFPNDPQFSEQWHYHNTGQSGGTANADINLLAAWDKQTGNPDVVVAIIDQGVDYNHPDLAQNMWVNTAELEGTSGVDDDGNGFVDDIYGYNFGDNTGAVVGQYHGTHVGGTVAALTNNAVGVSGIAGGSGSGDGVRLMSLAVFGVYSQGGFENSFVYAADNGAVIAQNSWGGGSRSLVLEDAIQYFIERAGFDNSDANFANNIQTGPMAGGIVIFAAGNSNTTNPDVGYPASFEPVIAVASTDHNDRKSNFSNYGEWVDISAPGSDILSTFPDNTYSIISGTSMACPHVSGVAALIVSEFGGPGFTPDQVRGRLLESADDISATNPSYMGLLGSGRLNAANALMVDDGVAPADIDDLEVLGFSHNSVTLGWTATGDSGHEGRASAYHIRYSTSPITASNFESATLVTNAIRPSSAGEGEEFVVKGLNASTTYYFAIKASDIFGNQSGISNVANASTDTSPEIQVTPGSISDVLYTGNQAVHILTIENTGGGTLEYSISKSKMTPAMQSGRQGAWEFKAYDEVASKEIYASQSKNISGQPEAKSKPRVSHKRKIHSETGARLFGVDYYYSTIDEIDPSDGTLINSFSAPEPTTGGPNGLAYDGEFLYYISGWESNQIHQLDPLTGEVIASKGFPSMPPIDALGHSGEFIYALNYSEGIIIEIDFENGEVMRELDLGVDLVGGMTFGGSRNTLFVSQSGYSIFEIDLSTSEIVNTINLSNAVWGLAYSEALGALLVSNVSSATIMMLDPDNGDLIDSFNSALYSGIAADEASGGNWLRFSARKGSVGAGDTEEVEVILDATGMNAGDYEQVIQIVNNSASNPEVSVPVSLEVIGAPKIETKPEQIIFEDTYIGSQATLTMTVKNIGTDDLNVANMTVSNAVFSVSPTTLTLSPDSAAAVAITFDPVQQKLYEATLTIQSNDPVDDELAVDLSGKGVTPPEISLSVEELTEELYTGEKSTQSIVVTNNGGSDLHFEILVQGDTNVGFSMGNKKFDAKTPVEMPQQPTLNTTAPHSGPVTLAGSYTGEYLSFGISDYGEIMPFQFPVGNEHLASGVYLSGYTVAYEAGGYDNVGYAAFGNRNFISPVSYTEITNNESLVEIEVITATQDNRLEITRLITFNKTEKFVRIETELRNTAHEELTNLVFKAHADWDVDQTIYNTWDFDDELGTFYAYDNNFVSIISNLEPDFADINGWDDYNRRSTSESFTGSPVFSFDGLEILHFELGNLGTSANSVKKVLTAYVAGESREDLVAASKKAISKTGWISVDTLSATVAPGASLSVDVLFNAYMLPSGEYNADIIFNSNDVSNPEVSVPAVLTVTSAPDIHLDTESLTFGDLFIGDTRFDSLLIINEGFELLTITEITSTHIDFVSNITDTTIGAQEAALLLVSFSPSAAGTFSAQLTLQSNDPDEASVQIQLSGSGLEPPIMDVQTDSLSETLYTGQTTTQFFEISNIDGGSPLEFSVSLGIVNVLDESGPLSTGTIQTDKPEEKGYHFSKPPGDQLYSFTRKSPGYDGTLSKGDRELTDENSPDLNILLDSLNAGYEAINALIPNRYDFYDGHTGYYISDGGNDMYDGGNFLTSNLGAYINYTDGSLSTSPYLGGGNYFTAKYPGLFVFAADLDGVTDFTIDGNLGADGSGSVDGTVIGIEKFGVNYLVFVKRVYDAWDPSVNHVIIVEDNGEATHEFSTYTDNDYHRVFNLDGIDRLYYLLFAGSSGGYIDNSDITAIANAFLDKLSHRQFLTVHPTAGVVEAGATMSLEATFSSRTLPGGTYDTHILINSNDPLNSLDSVYAFLQVIPASDIQLSTSEVNFGSHFVGSTIPDTILVYNNGIEPLVFSDISLDNSAFSFDFDTFTVAPGSHALLSLNFHPSSEGDVAGQLILQSNDPDEAEVYVQLLGVGLEPPVLEVSVDSLVETLYSGQTSEVLFEISNVDGGSPLEFNLSLGSVTILDASGPLSADEPEKTDRRRDGFEKLPDEDLYTFDRSGAGYAANTPGIHTFETPPLEDVLGSLNQYYGNINSLIPNRFDFTEGHSGYYINNGGSNMYDYGNFISSSSSGSLYYTGGNIQYSSGLGGNYFTAKYPGLFVLAADIDISSFYVQGYLGNYGSGSVDGSVISLERMGKEYLVFIKRVYDASTPSVNHIFIVENNGSVSHSFATYPYYDDHYLYNLGGVDRMYYLLFGGESGAYIDDEEMTAIASAFLNNASLGFLSIHPTSGVIEAGASATIQATFDSNTLPVGVYETDVMISHNDPAKGTHILAAKMYNIGEAPAPTDIVLSHSSIEENMPAGQLIGDLDVVYSTSLSTSIARSFTIVSGDDVDWFSIEGDKLLAQTSFNYEEKSKFTLLIEMVDAAGGTYSKSLVINVDDVNEAPHNIRISKNRVKALDPAGTIVGTLVTSDEDRKDKSFVYQLVAGGGDEGNSYFAINEDKLVVKGIFDFVETTSLSIRVKSSDPAGAYYERNFTIQVDYITGVGVNTAEPSVSIYPNPVLGDNAVLSLESNESGRVRVTFFNAIGQYQKEVQFEKYQQVHLQELDLSDLPNGVIFLKIETGNRVITKKLKKLSR